MLASTGEILAALSKALDMVEGQPPGHAFRTSRIAHEIAGQLQLSPNQQVDAFFACLIKDSGCSNNSVRIHKIFGGDDLLKKQAVKFVDWSNSLESVKYALSHIEWGDSISAKLRKFASIVGPPTKIMNEVTEARCTRGAAIALELGFNFDVANAIQALDEHWNGKGSPRGISGDQIPVLAQILCVAQTVEVFVTTFGIEATKVMVIERRKKWFSAEISDAALALLDRASFWPDHFAHVAGETVPFPVDADQLVRDMSLDKVCQCFAQIIDAKSTFTGEHSTRVTSYAVELAVYFGFERERLKTLEHAALLHDIGKLGVSNSILEKPSRLDPDEFDKVKAHPLLSTQILGQIRGFERVTEIASAHHERLDGKGYWQGLSGDQLDLDMRILTVSDVFDALTARRPYRDAMSAHEALAIMRKDERTAFDAACLRGLEEIHLGSAELRAA
jgi:HD-GYP domain-containing protein (c-di-GMP phosphodiesterase class II)